MLRDRSTGGPPSRRVIDRLSLWCACALLLGLTGFALLITVAKPVLSVFLFADVSIYLAVIFSLALAIWGLTWFYMAQVSEQGPEQ